MATTWSHRDWLRTDFSPGTEHTFTFTGPTITIGDTMSTPRWADVRVGDTITLAKGYGSDPLKVTGKVTGRHSPRSGEVAISLYGGYEFRTDDPGNVRLLNHIPALNQPYQFLIGELADDPVGHHDGRRWVKVDGARPGTTVFLAVTRREPGTLGMLCSGRDDDRIAHLIPAGRKP
jgi:hypothetical protein